MAATTNDDLARLLAQVALRDRAAFEQVYRATCAHLLGVAFRILNQRERAEEVLQESFMNVWHNAAGFNATIASPMTWLINIVRNKAIDSLRSGKSERASTVALDDEAYEVAADAAQQPQQLLDESLARLKIYCCAQDVTALQAKIISPDSLPVFQPMQWVEAEGQIQFRKRKDSNDYIPVLQLTSSNDIKPTEPDPNPYLQ